MRSHSLMLMEIYLNQLGESKEERIIKTKQYLKEITRWEIKSLQPFGKYIIYKPSHLPMDYPKPWGVFLEKLPNKDGEVWELKFGHYNEEEPKGKFFWDDNDPEKLHKSLFIKDVLDTKISPLIKQNKIKIVFNPYDGDGRGEDRMAYFSNMFSKTFNPQEYHMVKDGEYWVIEKL